MDNNSLEELKEIASEIAMIEGGLYEGYITFSYDRLLSVMGAGHPAEILDEILSPVYWDVISEKNVELETVIEMYEGLKSFKNEFKIKQLTPIIKKLKAFITNNGGVVEAPKISFDKLKERYIGKTLNQDKLQYAGDVWNLRLKDGKLEGHFYWNGEHHRYCDDFSISLDEEMVITDIDPLCTATADGGEINDCRYTLQHNGEFDKLLKEATE